MSGFTLHLQSATQYECIDDATSFVGQDASGSFGLLAGHARFMTVLGFGLTRFRVGQGDWEFLALPGGLVYFTGNQLYLNTRRYLRGQDYERIRAALRAAIRRRRRGIAGHQAEPAASGTGNAQTVAGDQSRETRVTRLAMKPSLDQEPIRQMTSANSPRAWKSRPSA